MIVSSRAGHFTKASNVTENGGSHSVPESLCATRSGPNSIPLCSAYAVTTIFKVPSIGGITFSNSASSPAGTSCSPDWSNTLFSGASFSW